LPKNAGKAWSSQEDAQICEEIRRGISFERIALATPRLSLRGARDDPVLARLVVACHHRSSPRTWPKLL
jgi:hypothetical protein